MSSKLSTMFSIWKTGGNTEEAKLVVERVDEENKTVTMNVVEGDIVKYFKIFKCTIQVTVKDKGSLVTWSVEYEKLNESGPAPDAYLNFAMGIVENVDAYILKAWQQRRIHESWHGMKHWYNKNLGIMYHTPCPQLLLVIAVILIVTSYSTYTPSKYFVSWMLLSKNKNRKSRRRALSFDTFLSFFLSSLLRISTYDYHLHYGPMTAILWPHLLPSHQTPTRQNFYCCLNNIFIWKTRKRFKNSYLMSSYPGRPYKVPLDHSSLLC